MARVISSSGVIVPANWTSRERGASFCHVAKIRAVLRFSPCMTSGSQ